MIIQLPKNTGFYFLLFLWTVWIGVSLFLINWLLEGGSGVFPTFVVYYIKFDVLKIYLISIPLTTLIAYKAEARKIKRDFANIIILNFLIAFLFYCFYEFRIAYIGASSISYETVFDYKLMSPFEYQSHYIETLKAYYFAALSRTIFIGLLLSVMYFVTKRLKK